MELFWLAHSAEVTWWTFDFPIAEPHINNILNDLIKYAASWRNWIHNWNNCILHYDNVRLFLIVYNGFVALLRMLFSQRSRRRKTECIMLHKIIAGTMFWSEILVNGELYLLLTTREFFILITRRITRRRHLPPSRDVFSRLTIHFGR